MSELPSDNMSMNSNAPGLPINQSQTTGFEEEHNDKITLFLDNEMIKLLDRF